jgi:general stress protein YciG
MKKRDMPISERGFASMSVEKRREIPRMGGKSVPAEKRTFSTDRALAKEAGRLGGANVPAEKRSFSTDRHSAAIAGAKAGASTAYQVTADSDEAKRDHRHGPFYLRRPLSGESASFAWPSQ